MRPCLRGLQASAEARPAPPFTHYATRPGSLKVGAVHSPRVKHTVSHPSWHALISVQVWRAVALSARPHSLPSGGHNRRQPPQRIRHRAAHRAGRLPCRVVPCRAIHTHTHTRTHTCVSEVCAPPAVQRVHALVMPSLHLSLAGLCAKLASVRFAAARMAAFRAPPVPPAHLTFP
jgi:hypothetical protein